MRFYISLQGFLILSSLLLLCFSACQVFSSSFIPPPSPSVHPSITFHSITSLFLSNSTFVNHFHFLLSPSTSSFYSSTTIYIHTKKEKKNFSFSSSSSPSVCPQAFAFLSSCLLRNVQNNLSPPPLRTPAFYRSPESSGCLGLVIYAGPSQLPQSRRYERDGFKVMGLGGR